jgi:hypothetical protein
LEWVHQWVHGPIRFRVDGGGIVLFRYHQVMLGRHRRRDGTAHDRRLGLKAGLVGKNG